ncbi:hypothetical protein [[Clostridium] innocuum]|nr:hypothetical protein [[Clostridium] innocuum]
MNKIDEKAGVGFAFAHLAFLYTEQSFRCVKIFSAIKRLSSNTQDPFSPD